MAAAIVTCGAILYTARGPPGARAADRAASSCGALASACWAGPLCAVGQVTRKASRTLGRAALIPYTRVTLATGSPPVTPASRPAVGRRGRQSQRLAEPQSGRASGLPGGTLYCAAGVRTWACRGGNSRVACGPLLRCPPSPLLQHPGCGCGVVGWAQLWELHHRLHHCLPCWKLWPR